MSKFIDTKINIEKLKKALEEEFLNDDFISSTNDYIVINDQYIETEKATDSQIFDHIDNHVDLYIQENIEKPIRELYDNDECLEDLIEDIDDLRDLQNDIVREAFDKVTN